MNDLTSSLGDEYFLRNNTQSDGDIRGVIEAVIKKVEQMTCTKLTDMNNFAVDDLGELKCQAGQMNNIKRSVETSLDRSKHRSGNRKSRVRHRKHKWKPYHKLTGDERRRLEERISRRAYRSREKMSASGLTLAPYNTTQFLMDDHNFREPDYDMTTIHETKAKEDYNSNSSEDFYSSPDDEEEFIQQQFSETYDMIHDAYINDMSKSDLVRELIRLEDEIENIEHTLRDTWEGKKSVLDVEAEMEKIQVFQVEIQKLSHENRILAKRNEMLQNRLSKIKAE